MRQVMFIVSYSLVCPACDTIRVNTTLYETYEKILLLIL